MKANTLNNIMRYVYVEISNNEIHFNFDVSFEIFLLHSSKDERKIKWHDTLRGGYTCRLHARHQHWQVRKIYTN